MAGSRITLKDVARAAGVHHTTVSLVLRGNTRFSSATRRRIRRIAAELGYTPDPIAQALTACRTRAARPEGPRVAYLTTAPSEPAFFERIYNRLFLEGAQAAARRHGYGCELILLGDGPAGGPLDERLRRSNYVGLILGALDPEVPLPPLNWGDFGLVRIDSSAIHLPIRSVCNDQMQAVQLAYCNLRELGYRRIGLAVGEADEDALGNLYTAGLYAEMMEAPAEDRIPPLLFEYHAKGDDAAAVLRSWAQRYRVEAVMSNWYTIREVVERAGFSVPEGVACAGLALGAPDPAMAGIVQNHRLVGARAVEELAVALRTDRSGLSEVPFATYVAGSWWGGASAPRKARA